MVTLEDIVKHLTYNRVNFLGCTLMLGGLVGSVGGIIYSNIEVIGISLIIGSAGFLFSALSEFGSPTVQIYQRTVEHIQRFGRLDEKFVAKYMQADYCCRQGVYMATKEFGFLEDYKKARKHNPSIIFNF